MWFHKFFHFKLLQIYITSISRWLHLTWYKTCQIVADVSKIGQFHEFFKIKFFLPGFCNLESLCQDWYDEYYDSDFEFRSDDEDEETSRKILTGIFKTLEDSGPVLNKLTFHRESSKETGSRLPRILPGQTETYETLHKLLEEMELLLKVWKNRVNHPFTAHLERKPEENNKEPDSGANVR